MIVFETETELDMLALRTFGISAKETETPIGRFGTGLKYALAVLLREDCAVAINAGAVSLTIQKEHRDFRGKAFDFIVARPLNEPAFDLGFTTDLGKDWELWQAFRELYSNTIDESGTARRSAGNLAGIAESGKTTICVTGAAFEAVFDERDEIIIEGKPLWENDDVAIHEGASDFMFYQGIRALKLKHQAAFRYNLKRFVDLTEDRTIKYAWQAENRVRCALGSCDNEDIIAKALTGGDKSAERKLEYQYIEKPSAAFANVVAKEKPRVPPSAVSAVATSVEVSSPSNKADLNHEHRERLERVATLLRRADIDVASRKIIAVGMLTADARYDARGGRLYLAEAAFSDDETLTHCIVNGLADLESFMSEDWLKGRLFAALHSMSSQAESVAS